MTHTFCQKLYVKLGEEFTPRESLVAVGVGKLGRACFSQVIEGKAIILPEPNFSNAQATIDLKPIDATTG
jgi:hypothetical protein